MKGVENLPSGKALVCTYHSPGFPFDMQFAPGRLLEDTGRPLCVLAHDSFFTFPGIGDFFRFCNARPANPKSARAVLEAGEAALVAPGGAFEAINGTPGDYRILWPTSRVGFARSAQAAGAPIVPMFTRNVAHMWWMPFARTLLSRCLFTTTGFPLLAFWSLGPFPVQLTTYFGPCSAAACVVHRGGGTYIATPTHPRWFCVPPLGKPIPTEGRSLDEIARLTREGIQALMDKYQDGQ